MGELDKYIDRVKHLPPAPRLLPQLLSLLRQTDINVSKVVEVIVSSVRPFQLMMGKIIGLASVGLLQFLIWIVLITTLSTVVLALFGVQSPSQEMMQMN